MKKIILIALIAFVTSAKAQIIYEHTYDSASVWNTCAGQLEQLMMVNFEVEGYQYVKINRCGKVMNIYDMTHSLVKTISLASVPLESSGSMGDFIYLSEHLFNTDPAIEFMYVYNVTVGGNGCYYTIIYNDAGTTIFSDTGAALIHGNFEQQQLPIYNTPNGTKMILSYCNGQAKVFGLGGTLSTRIEGVNHTANIGLGNAYPNPTANTTTIPYTLPQGTTQGELVFYNVQGVEVKRFKVDNTFSTLLISTTDIPSGTYYYQLLINGNASAAKKMVVVK
jgi:type IX secretion system substrate protein